MESVVYRDPVGAKIFERGMTLFPEDENYLLEYLRYLHSKDDTTNARVVFETCVNRLTQKPETVIKAKPLYAYFHKYESQFGELAQISKLESRMAELFPDDPKLATFSQRYTSTKFNPIKAPIIVSPAAQLRPKVVMPSIEHPLPVRRTQSPGAPTHGSPRDDYEELNRPRKLARGESPLKGAAGRRLDQQRRNQSSALHRELTFFLNILPSASTYDSARFNPVSMTKLLQSTVVPDFASWKTTQDRGGGAPRHASGTFPAFQRAQSPYTGGAGTGRPGHIAAAFPPQRPSSRGYEQYGAPAASYGQPQQQYGGYRY
ncbi:unnamed protein product [Parascedosporium putredinis]|uniref:mRNA 3'-end-processing protein RNA14 n=1 Tax=Parascedosporium putredinis TaxID=1442378 RepID=A0A9P1HBQ0_9PEZI|nr:unnamed protein product [Parascedosporium putredinis]CAI8003990.1 unnamed protein product [Parascedosporium putredinis]